MRHYRRDNRGRILRIGEYQRADGRYMFRYCESANKIRVIYSWRLTESDPQPRHLRPCKSIRAMANEIYCEKGVIQYGTKNI